MCCFLTGPGDGSEETRPISVQNRADGRFSQFAVASAVADICGRKILFGFFSHMRGLDLQQKSYLLQRRTTSFFLCKAFYLVRGQFVPYHLLAVSVFGMISFFELVTEAPRPMSRIPTQWKCLGKNFVIFQYGK